MTLPFSGYKTYAVAFAVVVLGITEGLMGLDVPGVTVGDDWLAWTLTGLGLGSIRDALKSFLPN